MRIAICDFDDKYLYSLLTYLYGKCEKEEFFSFTTLEDYEESLSEGGYDYTVMDEDFYEKWKDKKNSIGKLIILSAKIDNIGNRDEYQVIYKYGPMDGLYRIMKKKSRKTSGAKKYAIYSPIHHELTEMYGLSMCQMLSESSKVLLIDTMYCPLVEKLIRDGPRGSFIDVIYKLCNGKSDEIRELIEEYDGVDVLPFVCNPTDTASVNKEEWNMLIDYIDSLNYETYVFLLDEINQGFRSIMEYVDNCVLINKKGDYYKSKQANMQKYIRSIGTDATAVELLMSANNLTEGCYQLEELLTGNLGRYVRKQNY